MTETEIAQTLHLAPPQLPRLHTILAQLLKEQAIDKKGKRFQPAARSAHSAGHP